MNIEKNTALISIKEYDELREFKKAILEGKTIKIEAWYNDSYTLSFVDMTDEMKEISRRNEDLFSQNKRLDYEIIELKEKINSQNKDIIRLKSELEEAKKDTFWKWLTRK